MYVTEVRCPMNCQMQQWRKTAEKLPINKGRDYVFGVLARTLAR